jgi:hypothetical protein
VEKHQYDDSADYGNEKAIDIHASHTGHSKSIEQPAADYGSYDSKDDVQEYAFARFIDDFAAYESGD